MLNWYHWVVERNISIRDETFGKKILNHNVRFWYEENEVKQIDVVQLANGICNFDSNFMSWRLRNHSNGSDWANDIWKNLTMETAGQKQHHEICDILGDSSS